MKPATQKHLERWAEMTGNNLHFDVRKEIAEYYGLQYAKAYAELIESRERGAYPIYCEILIDSSSQRYANNSERKKKKE